MPIQETKKRKRNGGKLTDEHELGPTPPSQLIDSVMKKLLLNCEGTLKAKWGRLVTYVSGLSSDDLFDIDKFNPVCIVQHVIALVPNPSDTTNETTASDAAMLHPPSADSMADEPMQSSWREIQILTCANR